MKLLFDQNISYRIIKLVLKSFPDSEQVNRLGLRQTEDKIIWKYAKKYDYIIVTFDSDFVDIANVKGHPPKIIWLRLGNTSTLAIAQKLISSQNDIIEFSLDSDYGILEIK